MTDAEWNSWQSNWSGATGPLPDVRSRAQREALLHRVANVAFFALIAFTLVVALPVIGADRNPAVRWIGWVIIAFFGAMSVGYLLIQRGIAPDQSGNPRDAIAFLERRLRVEQRTAHLVRWVYAGLCFAFVFVFPRVVAGQHDANLQMAITFPGMALTLIVTFTAPWWVARRNRKHQDEIDRWRQWMDEQHL